MCVCVGGVLRFFPVSSLLWGFALTFNWPYLPEQISGSDTCHVLERIDEEAEETRGSDLGP